MQVGFFRDNHDQLLGIVVKAPLDLFNVEPFSMGAYSKGGLSQVVGGFQIFSTHTA